MHACMWKENNNHWLYQSGWRSQWSVWLIQHDRHSKCGSADRLAQCMPQYWSMLAQGGTFHVSCYSTVQFIATGALHGSCDSIIWLATGTLHFSCYGTIWLGTIFAPADCLAHLMLHCYSRLAHSMLQYHSWLAHCMLLWYIRLVSTLHANATAGWLTSKLHTTVLQQTV